MSSSALDLPSSLLASRRGRRWKPSPERSECRSRWGARLWAWAVAASTAALTIAQGAAASGWHSEVETPLSATVLPVRIVRTAGAVSDPQALLRPGERLSATLKYTPGGPQPQIVLDFGKEIGGVLQLDVVAASGAPVLQADYSEQLAHLTDGSETGPSFSRSGDPRRSDEFPIDSSGPLKSPYGVQGGERYLRLSLAAPGTVALRSAAIEFTAYRGPLRGYFLSSEQLLNRIWHAGAYTLNLDQIVPGMVDLPGVRYARRAIIDGAKRDRAIWSGDLAIAGRTAYYTTDPRYVRDSLQTIGEHAGTVAALPVAGSGREGAEALPGECSPATSGGSGCTFYSATYSMIFTDDLYDYYRFTGDLRFVRREWPAVRRQLAWYASEVGPDGLLPVTAADGWDWNVEPTTGELSYVNAVYCQALTDAGRLADALGDPRARAYRAAARKLRDAVNARLWDARLGIYDASTTSRGTVVQDANVYPVLSGIAPARRARSVLRRIARALASPYGALNVAYPPPPPYSTIISPYMGGLQLAADFQAGLPGLALALMRTEWGHMVNGDPGGTTWERIHPDGTLGGADSAAHGWATAPTWVLSRYVLGVSPASPGFARWSVAPQAGDLAWAEGAVPTPHGRLGVRWKRGAGGCSFALAVDAPRGTEGEVAVPLLGAERTITRDGAVVWARGAARPGVRARREGSAVALEDQRGSHFFAWSAQRICARPHGAASATAGRRVPPEPAARTGRS